MRLYLSGPMSGHLDLNYPAFDAAESLLHLFNYNVSNPAQYPVVDDETWESCLKRDLVDVCESDGIATLHGWSRSKGARFEVRTARMLKMPVHPVMWWTRNWEEFTQ